MELGLVNYEGRSGIRIRELMGDRVEVGLSEDGSRIGELTGVRMVFGATSLEGRGDGPATKRIQATKKLWRAGQQLFCVTVLRTRKDLSARAQLDDFAKIQNQSFIRNMLYDRKIVRNKDHA